MPNLSDQLDSQGRQVEGLVSQKLSDPELAESFKSKRTAWHYALEGLIVAI